MNKIFKLPKSYVFFCFLTTFMFIGFIFISYNVSLTKGLCCIIGIKKQQVRSNCDKKCCKENKFPQINPFNKEGYLILKKGFLLSINNNYDRIGFFSLFIFSFLLMLFSWIYYLGSYVLVSDKYLILRMFFYYKKKYNWSDFLEMEETKFSYSKVASKVFLKTKYFKEVCFSIKKEEFNEFKEIFNNKITNNLQLTDYSKFIKPISLEKYYMQTFIFSLIILIILIFNFNIDSIIFIFFALLIMISTLSYLFLVPKEIIISSNKQINFKYILNFMNNHIKLDEGYKIIITKYPRKFLLYTNKKNFTLAKANWEFNSFERLLNYLIKDALDIIEK